MNYISDLKPHIGSQKTLIVCSADLKTSQYFLTNDNVFLHWVPNGLLFRYDPKVREMLEHHLHKNRCSQIIFVADDEPQLVSHLENSDRLKSLRSALSFNLSVLLRKHKDAPVRPHIRRQMLLELYVIDQCNNLLDYFFLKKEVSAGIIQVKGIVPEPGTHHLKQVFKNGISYNDLLTLN
jgi:hypothetical protein